MVADALGECFEGGAEVGDLGVESGEAAGVDLVVAALIDEGAQGRVAVERGAGDTGSCGDGGEGDGLIVGGERFEGGVDGGDEVVVLIRRRLGWR